MEVLCYLNEIWKDVPGYFGLYQVSNYGRVRSLGFDKWHPGRILKPGKDKDGYYFFYLTKNKVKKFYRCNRLVWEAFNGPIPEGVEILRKYNNQLPSISNQRYNGYLKEIQTICGITKNLHTHLFRKTYGTRLLNRGVRLETVSKCLGHSSTQITQQSYSKLLKSTIVQEVASVF